MKTVKYKMWHDNANTVKGLLIDISGVLYNSGVPINGSIMAVKRFAIIIITYLPLG